MRSILILLLTTLSLTAFAQNKAEASFPNARVMVVKKNPVKGFYHDYILYIPAGTPLKQETFLLVEPNNTGKLSDSMELHTRYAIDLASVSSVGHDVSESLKIPLLVPVFPRPESMPLVYTHALDKDVMEVQSTELKRLDLQLLAMVRDARGILTAMDIQTAPKFLMNGFSASGSFTNRFSFIHPDKIQALAIGGFNGELMLPRPELNGIQLNYPLGTGNFNELFGAPFDSVTYKSLPQWIYMGRLDDNDAVQYDDAYDENERRIINKNLGAQVYERYLNCQEIYHRHGIQPTFKTYEGVGHWTTSEMNTEVIRFFAGQMK